MKYKKAMTKALSILVMASMLGTSVQIPTYAELTDATKAILEDAGRATAPNAEGSAESGNAEDTVAVGDEDNKTEGADAANENAEAASNSGANENSQDAANTASSSNAYNSSSSTANTYNTENASDGTSTVPSWRMRFLPSFCFSSSFFFLVISPP